jgi:hypothetical protein
LGLKELVPPYLDPNLSDEELMTGVSFASAGSGFDPLTPTLSVQLSNSLNILSQHCIVCPQTQPLQLLKSFVKFSSMVLQLRLVLHQPHLQLISCDIKGGNA